MPEIVQNEFRKNLLSLLKETFEGPSPDSGGSYLENGAGLFQTLDALTAEQASHALQAGVPTIAAHCAHLAYYVSVNHNYAIGREQQVDWRSSWRLQQVGDQEWEELKHRVRREYDALIETLESHAIGDDLEVGEIFPILAHTAYHLGAIRRAIREMGPLI
jgi:hypothetical protein